MAAQSSTDAGMLEVASVSSAVTDISIAAWVKISSTGRQHFIFENGVTGGFGQGYGVFVEAADNKVHVDIAFVADVAGTTVLSSGVWYHVVVTYTALNWTIYINGSSDGTGAGVPFALDANAKTTWFGYNDSGTTFVKNFNGDLAEVGFWDRVLTGTEISNLASCSKKPGDLTTNLLVYLPLTSSASFGTNQGSGGNFTVDGTLTQTTPPSLCGVVTNFLSLLGTGT